MEATFRLADPTDMGLLVEFMREYYEFDHLPFNEPLAHAALRNLLSNDSLGRIWLIYAEDQAIGYVVLTLGYSLEYQGRDAFIDELYLRSAYRGQGIGTQSLQFVERAARSLGVRALHLEVERKNTAAQAFYRQEGFADHNRYLMTKLLSAKMAGA
jgi:GNAT superfamily N-acetyltransferase